MSTEWTKIYQKYKGQWVALAADEKTVLGAGKTAKDALAMAKKKSSAMPFLVRMPEKISSFVGLV